MTHARVRVSRFDDRGATAVEYALIAALIAVVIMVSVALLGGNLLNSFTNSNDAIEDAIAGQPAVVAPAAETPTGTDSGTTPTGTDSGTTPTGKGKGKGCAEDSTGAVNSGGACDQ